MKNLTQLKSSSVLMPKMLIIHACIDNWFQFKWSLDNRFAYSANNQAVNATLPDLTSLFYDMTLKIYWKITITHNHNNKFIIPLLIQAKLNWPKQECHRKKSQHLLCLVYTTFPDCVILYVCILSLCINVITFLMIHSKMCSIWPTLIESLT